MTGPMIDQSTTIPDDLAGSLAVYLVADLCSADFTLIRVEQDLGPFGRRTAVRTVAQELLRDVPVAVAVVRDLCETPRPWARPDANPFPAVVLFPRLEETRVKLRGIAHHVRTRAIGSEPQDGRTHR